MALSQLSSSDAGASARDKINAGLLEADKVANLSAILAALQIQLAPYTDLVGGTPNRPGDSRTLFTRQMTGAPKLRPAIDKGTVENGGDLGQVLRISGADTDPTLGYIDVAPRRAYYMRPGRAYLVRHAFARFQDPTDPEQNAVELRFQNLSSTFGQVSNVRFGNAYAPAVTDGSFFVDTFIGKAGAPGTPSYVVPPTSAYGVPFFRVYGNGHLTDLGEVWLYDVSDALAGGADIASIIARVAKLEVTQSANVIFASSWTDLNGRTGRVAGAGAEVPDSDTGTHTDPVTSSANTPNAGRYQWSVSPAGWRWVSVTTAKQAAAFIGAGINPATRAKLDTALWVAVDPDTGILIKATAADFKSYLQDNNMPKTYPSKPPGLTAEATSKVVLPYDEQRANFQVQCQTHDLAVNWYDAEASKDRDMYIYAGVIPDWIGKGPGAVSVTAYPSSLRTIPGAALPAKIVIEQDRYVPGYISGSLFADTVLSRYPDQSFSRAYRNVLRDGINQLNDQGKWPSKGILQLPVHSLANATTNLLDPTTPFLIILGATGKGLGIVPYVSLVTLEATAAMDTVKLPADIGLAIDSGFYFIKPGLTAEGSGTLTGNSGSYYLKPNAGTSGAPAAGFRNGSGAQDSPSAARGSLLMMNRIVSTDYDAYVEGTIITKTTARPGVTPGARSIFVGGNHSSNGSLADGSLVEWRALGHMPGWNAQGTCLDWRTFLNNVFAAGNAANAAMGA